MIDNSAMFKLSYGLFVLTAKEGDKDNGCIVNTVTQITVDPLTVTVAVNKSNYTHDMIMNTKKLNVSVLSEDCAFEVFKHFGFQSGRDVNKFADFTDCKVSGNGLRYITKGTNAYLSAWVKETVDLGTHTLFIAQVTYSEVLDDAPSATYAYYHAHIKPQPVDTGKRENGQVVWRCMICGYEYVGEELPDDFICPLCKHPKSDFEKIVK